LAHQQADSSLPAVRPMPEAGECARPGCLSMERTPDKSPIGRCLWRVTSQMSLFTLHSSLFTRHSPHVTEVGKCGRPGRLSMGRTLDKSRIGRRLVLVTGQMPLVTRHSPLLTCNRSRGVQANNGGGTPRSDSAQRVLRSSMGRTISLDSGKLTDLESNNLPNGYR